MKKQIPNFITLLNLSSGTLGVIFIINGEPVLAAYMVFLASVFDFLDGFTARMLNAYSELGKSLDSLADMVSFGLLPGILVYDIMSRTAGVLPEQMDYLPFFSLAIPAFSAVRLAVFNNDDNQKESFRGLPTPANALFFASLSYLMVRTSIPVDPVFRIYILLFLVFLMSVLLVSGIRMFSLKIKSFGVRENITPYSFLFLSAIAVLILGIPGIAVSIALYILISVVSHYFSN